MQLDSAYPNQQCGVRVQPVDLKACCCQSTGTPIEFSLFGGESSGCAVKRTPPAKTSGLSGGSLNHDSDSDADETSVFDFDQNNQESLDRVEDNQGESEAQPNQFSKLKDMFTMERINPILSEICDTFNLAVKVEDKSSDSDSADFVPPVCTLAIRQHRGLE